jgi:hypothetical protein
MLVLAHVLQRPVALGLDVGVHLVEFGEAGRDRRLRLGQRDVPVGEGLDEPLGELLGIVEVDERVQEPDLGVAQPVDVLGQHLRVERHDRAVEVVVGVGELLALVADARA